MAEYINKITQAYIHWLGSQTTSLDHINLQLLTSTPPIPPNTCPSYFHILFLSPITQGVQFELPAYAWVWGHLSERVVVYNDCSPSPRIHQLTIALQQGVEPHEPCWKADWSCTGNYTTVCS